MARDTRKDEDYTGPLRQLLVTLLVITLFVVAIVWRIDSPRVERFRAEIADAIMPNMSWAMAPVRTGVDLARDLRSYQQIYQQNQELKRELQKMREWREAALQHEQENARLLDLNRVRLDPKFTHVTGVVLADSGSPFRQSVLLNVGRRDGIQDGWATMDGLGLVGRIAGVGQETSRVILLTDSSSRLPVVIRPSGQRAIVIGDNTAAPPIEFLENRDQVRAGDTVETSGDGQLFAPGLLVGQVVEDADGRLRVRLSADQNRLEFLRVLRHRDRTPIDGTGDLVGDGVDNAAVETDGGSNG